ncbi:MAG: hypothetical protein CME65_10390 [Halobacteriovoraceae bacterium]|nr:hypothetical protein [Halobacteriovoraceae bacterium]
MASFLVSKILIFGVPIVFVGALQYLRTKKKFSLNTIDSIYSLVLGFSASQIFGLKFEFPSETVEFIPWFAIIFSGVTLVKDKRVKGILYCALSFFLGWILLGPLLSDSLTRHFEWALFVILSYFANYYSFKISEKLIYNLIVLVLVFGVGIYIFMAGSISIGQFLIAVGLIETSRLIFEKILKAENTKFSLTIPCLLVGGLEFFHYGF